SFAQFVRGQAPQWLGHGDRLTLPEAASYMLDLETVYKALYDVAGVRPDERVFVEGAAGGTGLYAIACAVLRGARVTGLVSTEAKARRIAERGAAAVNRIKAVFTGIFTPVPAEAAARARWIEAGRAFTERVRTVSDGDSIDVIVSSVGRYLFPRMIDLLGHGGRLVFYGATSGYTLTFLGKPGTAPVTEMYARAGRRSARAPSSRGRSRGPSSTWSRARAGAFRSTRRTSGCTASACCSRRSRSSAATSRTPTRPRSARGWSMPASSPFTRRRS